MTDQRARAKAILDALPVMFTCSQYGSVQLCKEAEAECLDTILTALADERRRVWEEAAGIAEMFSINKQQIHPDIAWDNMSESARTVCHMTCQNIALAIRAKAHAGQEG